MSLPRLLAVAVALVAAAALVAGFAVDAAPPAPDTTEGRLSVIWIDAAPQAAPQAAQPAPPPEFWLHKSDHSRVRLNAPPHLRARLQALDRQPVRLRGHSRRDRRNSFEVVAAEAAPDPQASPSAAGTAATVHDNVVYHHPVTGKRPWVNLLCKFADRPAEDRDAAYFSALFASTRPGLDYYWKEQSNGQMSVAGSATTRWLTLPQPYDAYVYQQDGIVRVDLQRAADDCIGVADAEVDFSKFHGINMMFNDSLGCCAYGGGWWMERDGIGRFHGITWLPPWGWMNHTLMAHEMGHGMGLAHSRGNNQTYRNLWDVMSDIWHNCAQAQDPVLGCLGQHTIGFHKRQLGWVPDAAVYDAAPGTTQQIRLEKLERPAAGLTHLARIPIMGSSTHYYTVEARRRYSFDARLPSAAVVIHEVSYGNGESANVVDGDGNFDPYDAGTRWLPGEVFEGINGIRVSVDGTDGRTGYLVTITRPNDLIFKDDFETGGVLAWSSGKLDGGDVHASTAGAMAGIYGLAVDIDDNNQAHLTDHTPAAERSYRSRFLFFGNQMPMAAGDRFTIFGVYNDTALVAMIELRRNGMFHEMRLVARQDEGTTRSSPWLGFDNNGHAVLFEWAAASAPGAADGHARLQLDGGPEVALDGLANGNLRVERALLGAVSGVDTGTRGSIYFDEFVSTRF